MSLVKMTYTLMSQDSEDKFFPGTKGWMLHRERHWRFRTEIRKQDRSNNKKEKKKEENGYHDEYLQSFRLQWPETRRLSSGHSSELTQQPGYILAGTPGAL